MDDAEVDMAALAYRVQVADLVDKMFEDVGKDRLVKQLDGTTFVHIDVLMSLAQQMSLDGQKAVYIQDYSYASAMAKCATIIHVLALRARGEEPNVFEEQFRG